MDWLKELEAIFIGYSPEEVKRKKEIEKLKSILLSNEEEEEEEEADE